MTRFLYITDTHYGANPIGFHQQPAYPEQLEELVYKLEQVVQRERVDFVLHGGDLIDRCEPEIVQEAAKLFRFSVPFYLTLGNHDVDRLDAMDIWLKYAPEWFPEQSAQYSVVINNCVLHIVPNHWEQGTPFYWKANQDPYVMQDQVEQLEQAIRSEPNKQHILAIHCPAFGVPSEQTGKDEIIHDIPRPFQASLREIVQRHSNVHLVLSGHNHIQTLRYEDGAVYSSGSAFMETPFEYRIIELTPEVLQYETFSLLDEVSFATTYRDALSYVQGRPKDRSISMQLY